MYELESIKDQRILYSYLNWGKGHLSRSIGVIRVLIQQGNTIIVAAEPQDKDIITSYFPSIDFIAFAGYPFQFTTNGNFTSDLWKLRKELSVFIKTEQKQVETIVTKHHISLVISDHRYGFRSHTTPSIFVTHQVQLALKWWQQPAQLIHRKLYAAFDHVWIMDDAQNSMAGNLSRNTLRNASFIGHFSRFKENEVVKDIVLGVVNGPQPFNQQLLDQLVKNPEIDCIITSLSHSDPRVIQAKNWLETDIYFYRAKFIYAYCGYSTLMDLKQLKIAGKLIATPGQNEQEYLVHLHF